MKRVVLIGSGNVAEAFARAFAPGGAAGEGGSYRLVQLFARNEARGREVARLAGTEWCGDPCRLAPADLYLLSVSDGAVGEVAAALPFAAGAVVAHTAGSVGLEALPATWRRGVVYPLQTFTQGRPTPLGEVPLLVEGDDARTLAELKAFARTLSGRVAEADSALRGRIHLAAVFACNFSNHMYALGRRLLAEAGAEGDLLLPLMAETAAKALAAGDPARVQTGPAVRGDGATLRRHEELLRGHEDWLEIYRTISKSIWETSRKI